MFLSLIHDALKNLTGNIMRSSLTMLGVIIGVASVIAMIAIVEGGQVWLVRSIERLGTNLVFVWKKSLTVEEQRLFQGRSHGLEYGDALAIRIKFPDLQVVPVIELDQQVEAGDRHFSGEITATSPEYALVRNFHPQLGRFILEEDMQQWKRIAVIGQEVAEQLFGKASPLHQEIKIGDQRFIIVGVMQPKGTIYGTNYDEMVFIPITTALRRYQGKDTLRSMIIHVPHRSSMDTVMQKLHIFLIQRHDGVDDVRVRSQGDFLNAVDRTIWTFRIVLGGIAVVALVVGGIGIMNIMLVTVTERTKEIGLRKALGAKRRDILLQFLVESVAISVVGGLIGVFLGILAAYGFGNFVANAMPGGGDWGAVIRPSAIVIAFSFALGVGMIFGLYPAMKASNLEPAEALRYQ